MEESSSCSDKVGAEYDGKSSIAWYPLTNERQVHEIVSHFDRQMSTAIDIEVRYLPDPVV
jgi:hypothetical protein